MTYSIDEIKSKIPFEDHEHIPTEEEMKELIWVWYTVYEVIEWRKKMAMFLLDQSWWLSMDQIQKIVIWEDKKKD